MAEAIASDTDGRVEEEDEAAAEGLISEEGEEKEEGIALSQVEESGARAAEEGE